MNYIIIIAVIRLITSDIHVSSDVIVELIPYSHHLRHFLSACILLYLATINYASLWNLEEGGTATCLNYFWYVMPVSIETI